VTSADGTSIAYEQQGEGPPLILLHGGSGEPALFGHSFGGLLAIEAARTAPVRALVAYEPAVLVGEYREQADLAAQMQALIDDGNRREAPDRVTGDTVGRDSVTL